MKIKLIYAAAILSITNFCFGQDKIEKYCEVRMYSKWSNDNDQKVSINLGNPNIYFKDSTVKNRLLELAVLKNSVDVLDYMSKLKWSLVSIGGYGGVQIFYFKKEFDKTEFTIDN